MKSSVQKLTKKHNDWLNRQVQRPLDVTLLLHGDSGFLSCCAGSECGSKKKTEETFNVTQPYFKMNMLL